jgi:hypothetical protein
MSSLPDSIDQQPTPPMSGWQKYSWELFCHLFPLPFILISAGTGWILYAEYRDYRTAQNWIEIPAQIRRVEMTTGVRNNVRETKAEYDYELGERRFHGSRVTIYSGSDNLGDFQIRAFRELKHYADSGKPFRCYVDPKDPSESVIYREFRQEIFILLLVCTTGFGLFGVGLLIIVMLGGHNRQLVPRRNKML